MPRLLSNRKPVARPEDLKDNRFEYLNLQQAQPALGLAPENDQGYTLQTDATGKVTYTNTLGKLQFENQVITATEEDVDIEINGQDTNSNIILTPFQYARVEGNFEVSADLAVTGQATIDGDFRVSGEPLGTFPLVQNTLYVTPDGDDRNDGTAMDSTRACRTISGAVRSPFYQPGTAIKVLAGTYFEDNPIPLKPYTSVVGSDLRTTFVEPLNKDLDLFHVNSGVYIAQMQMRNLRRGAVERYAPGGAGTYTTGAYCVAFPPNLENPIDVYYSPYIQNCTNQSGPWLKDGTMFVPNQTVQIPVAAGTSTWAANETQITVTLTTGTIAVGMAINDAANEGYRNAQLLLERNKIFLQKQVVAYVNDTNPGFEYDRAKCYRDVGYIVDAVSRDARFGGNKRSIEAGLAYWSGNDTLIAGEQTQTVDAIQYLRDISLDIVANNTVTNVYDTSTSQVIDLNLDKGSVVSTRITESYNLIASIIESGENVVPETRQDLLGLIYPTGLSPNAVNVASTITAITTLSGNTYLITLSTSTVSPSDNATVYFGYTSVYPFLDQDVPEEWRMPDDDGIFADRRLDPTGSGGGALVDGNAPSLRSPIQSFVFDAFTQVNQGGIGIHIINNGYAQLVSVFTIMCSQAVIVENGGIASITNSNANFGDTCLTAKGLGKLAFQGFVVNPPYPTNVPNGEYYPLGYWPQKQQMEVFIPSDRDRPHIGQVMEVIPPDTYINYEGVRVPFVNEAGYPGYLVVTANTSTITTGSYTINDIDVTNIAVGHTLYVRDVLGSEVSPINGEPYVTTGTQVVDVNYRSITLDRPILTGYSDLNNPNWFNLYFCGNAYYTVLSSNIDTTLASTVTTQATLVAGQETTTSLAISYAKNLALRVIQNIPVTGFVYDKVKCARDTGIIVDSIVSDLLFNDNGYTQANFSGLQYWNQAGYTGSIAEEITTTTNAINFVKELALNIVQNVTTGSYTTTATQNTSLPAATLVEASYVEEDFDLIVDILTNGTAGVTDRVVANGTDVVSVNAQRGYDILQANKSFIQEQAIAFVEDTKTPGFEYDMSLCYRDVGYMVDSVSFDLLYGGNRQAIQSGVYYYGFSGSQSAIPGEQVQTTAAYARLQEILADIVTNTPIRKSLTNTLTQVTTLTSSTSVIGTEISTIIDKITTIIENGPEAADVKQPISHDKNTSTSIIAATEILKANREFIKAEIISYVDAQYGSGFVYDQGKCKRDTGLIVDAIALDLFHPTPELSQSNFAGLQYWNQDQYVGTIANELTTTTNAIRYVQSLAREIVQGITTGTRYQSTVTQITSSSVGTLVEADIVANDFEFIVDIVVDGIAGVTDKIVPNGFQTTASGIINAYALLTANKEYIQTEAVAFVESTKTPGFTYDQSLCYRDVGYMVDSVAFDLLHPNGDQPSNKQAIQSGVYYYGYNASESAIAGEIPQTTAAYNYIRELIPYIVQGITTTTYQTFVPQVTNLTTASGSVITDLQSYIDHIVDIINNGPSAANAKVPVNLEETLDVDAYNAYNILMANRAFIQEEVIAYINSQNSLGTYQSVYPQVFDTTLVGGEDATTSVADKFDIIANIIKNGAESSPAIQRPRQYVDFNQNILNAKKLLDKNRLFIQAETVAFVDSIWPSKFSYDPNKCSRDTGLIVDSLAQDLLFNGSSQSKFAGIQYWNQGLTVIPGEQTTTTNAVKYLKELAQKIVKNDTSGYRYSFSYNQVKCARDTGLIVDALTQDLLFDGISQSTFAGIQYWNQTGYVGTIANELTTTTNAINYVKSLAQSIVQGITTGSYTTTATQNTSLPAGSSAEALIVENEFDLIVEILTTGTAGVTDKIVPNGIVASTITNIVSAYDLLVANKEYIQEQTIAFVEDTKTSGFTYDPELCYRDVGYMVDSVAFDLLYGGNKQAIQSGVYYYGYDENSTAVPNEIPQTTAAYNFIKQLVPYILYGVTTSTYQSSVSQITALTTATFAEVAAIQSSIDLITNIVNNGPDEVTVKQPIGLTASSTASVVAAAVMMNANRDFIKAETIAYINETFKGAPLQVTTLTAATTAQTVTIAKDFDIIVDILTNGTDGITDRIVPNGIDPIDNTNVRNAYNLLQANKEYLQGEVVAYVDYNSKFEYDSVKCARDTGLIVDAIALDILYPTTWDSQSTFAGIQYWNQGNYVGTIANELTTTTNAITYVSSIAQKIVVNDKGGTRYQNTVTQTTSTMVATAGEAALIGTNFGEILDILSNGTAGVTDRIIPNGRRSISTNTNYAYNLLLANKNYIIAEAIAYVEATKTSGFVYDRSKCARDVGYMIDSVAFDLLHGGNKQSIQSGVYYYAYQSNSTAIPNEIPQTTAAYNRLRSILPSILSGIEIERSLGNNTKQVTYMLPANSNAIARAQSKVDRITSIIDNGPGIASTLTSISLVPSADPNSDRVYDLLMANREFIKDEIIAYINSNFTGFEYDKDLCYRDVGYMVDSVSFDLLYGGNKQAVQSGVYYYGYESEDTAIPGEIPQTTSAYNFIEQIVGDIVTGTLITNPQQSTVPQVTNLSYTYDQDKCYRDTGILVDGFVIDLLFRDNGYTQSNFAGLQYWNQAGYTGSIAQEITTTTNAVRYLKELAKAVVINDTNTSTVVRYQTTVTQVTNLTTATYDQRNKVSSEFDIILNILTTGTAGVTDLVVANGIEPVSEDAENAYDILLANKEYLQAEVIAYVESTKAAGFAYDQEKCYRDVGFMVDSIAFDVLYGGNRQAIHSGVYYYGFSSTATVIANQIEQTTAAYERLKQILPLIVTNVEIEKSPNNTLTQVVSLTTATSSEGVLLESMVDLITAIINTGTSASEVQSPVSLDKSTDPNAVAAVEILKANREFIQEEIISYINYEFLVGTDSEAQLVRNNVNLINRIIETGPEVVATKEPIGLTASTDRRVLSAARLLKANRDFIRAETIAYINNTYNTGFLYDKTKCRRDTGLIVDSIATDLLYEGTTESTFAGLQYWNQADYTGTIKGEITTTTNAVRYLKELVQQLVVNETIAVTPGNTATQVTNLTASNDAIGQVVAGNVDVILNILTNGTAGVTDTIVPNGKAKSDPEIVAAHAILQANKDFLKEEIVARINYDNSEFDYDRETCKRDIGYIVDSISFDLLHGGNRQSVTSGVYYYGFDAADTVIDDQVPQTTAAYNYIKEIVGKIVKGEQLTKTAQLKVKQVLSVNTATDTEVSLLEDKIDVITNIINNGPDVAPAKQPIAQTASTSTAVLNAYDLLMANRAFIQAEVLAHIDNVYTNTPNYDKNKCFRDMGAVVDAVGYDLIYGGNYNSVNTGNGYFLRKGQYHIVRLEQNVTDPTLFIDGATVRFYQQSYISASGYLFEYVGAGTQYGALPQVGTADPVQSKEVVQLNNGKVFFTSTDQNGDFRIGPTLVISQSTGVLSGRTFQKSLYAEMTPFILVVGA